MNQNWIVENLNNAFSTWNGKLGELWGLVTTDPQTFKDGAVWSVMQTLHNGMPGIKAKRKQLVRKTLMRAKAQSERTAEQRQESPEEYAQTEVQQGVSDVAARTGNTAKSTARMSYRKFRAMQEKRKNLTLQGSAQSASKPTEKEKVTVPTQTERREMFKKQRFRQKAIAAKTPALQAPVPSSATPAPPRCRVQMQQRLKRQHLTREAVRRYKALMFLRFLVIVDSYQEKISCIATQRIRIFFSLICCIAVSAVWFHLPSRSIPHLNYNITIY